MRVRHLADENRENSFSVDRLRLYTGSPESAREAALRDLDQYEVKAILAWKGDPNKRSEMKFWVEYEDGDAMWVSYKPDLVNCEPYQDFIHAHPELFALRFSLLHVSRHVAVLRSQPITGVQPNDVFYLDIRSIHTGTVYDTMTMPDKYFKRYVCECLYTQWNKKRTKIEAYCPVLETTFRDWDNYNIMQCGHIKEFDPETMVLVTPELCVQYPELLLRRNRAQLLRQYQASQLSAVLPRRI